MACLAVAYAFYKSKELPPLLLLDIQAGEPIGDAMSRSSLKKNHSIVLDMQGLRLPMGGKESSRYQVRLQGGEGKSALIKWTPVGGIIWSYTGWLEEIDLIFANFHLTRADAPDWVMPEDTYELPAGTLQSDIDAITDIYDSVMAMNPRPPSQPSCSFHNLIPQWEMPGAKSRAPFRGGCWRTTMQTRKLSIDALHAVLREFYEKVMSEQNTEPKYKTQQARVLNLGQWWLPNGSQLQMIVTLSKVRSNDAEQSPLRFNLNINVREYYRANIATSVAGCFDQQAIFPEQVLYTQDQSSQLLHKIMHYMYPPKVDGQALTDPIQIQEMEWVPKKEGGYGVFNFVGGRRAFCEQVVRFQKEIGYDGIQAPLSQFLD